MSKTLRRLIRTNLFSKRGKNYCGSAVLLVYTDPKMVFAIQIHISLNHILNPFFSYVKKTSLNII